MHPIWEKHRGLVWSNPNASDSVRIRAALLKPRFLCLLDVAEAFGLERLQEEWEILTHEADPEIERAREPVERILRNIEEGFRRAAAS